MPKFYILMKYFTYLTKIFMNKSILCVFIEVIEQFISIFGCKYNIFATWTFYINIKTYDFS